MMFLFKLFIQMSNARMKCGNSQITMKSNAKTREDWMKPTLNIPTLIYLL